MDRPALRSIGWRKGSRSKASSNCVEVAALRSGVGVRDSRSPAGPVLTLTAAQWAAFVNVVKAGKHDLG